MPRTTFPPTPAPSVDIVGKDSGIQVASKDKASFTLPPPAIAPSLDHDAPIEGGSKYSLPPPPTRTRKIIQMTPKMDAKKDAAESNQATAPVTGRHGASGGLTATRKASGKKQPSSTSQAGKKMARKTAHSVIERRRRSKMNEEFGVLKNMIPACQNQDMHKLAILQASIEYLRYLEQCVTNLKAANGLKSGLAIHRPPPVFQQSTDDDDEEDYEGDSDVEMTGQPELPSARADNQQQNLAYTSPHCTMTSPALDAIYRKPTSCTSPLSDLPSPAFGPLNPATYRSFPQSTPSVSTSPTLMPSKEADKEATAALLMLNKDRRNTTSSSSSSGRGMSVKDLLSS
ncbi:MAG: hypothetical protein Q9208_000932 [Pyrenodesmia sp. 3 TL-2023]